MGMKFRAKWLIVPSLSQGNIRNLKPSHKWCGRTSCAMVYNYYKAVRGAPDQFIVNNQVSRDLLNGKKAPFDLIYPDGELAGGYDYVDTNGVRQRGKFGLTTILKSALAGRESAELYPLANRKGPMTREKMLGIYERAFASIDRNNPVVIYTGRTGRAHTKQPRHIVVVSGYPQDPNGDVWLLIEDPARVNVGSRLGPGNVDTGKNGPGWLGAKSPELGTGVCKGLGAQVGTTGSTCFLQAGQ